MTNSVTKQWWSQQRFEASGVRIGVKPRVRVRVGVRARVRARVRLGLGFGLGFRIVDGRAGNMVMFEGFFDFYVWFHPNISLSYNRILFLVLSSVIVKPQNVSNSRNSIGVLLLFLGFRGDRPLCTVDSKAGCHQSERQPCCCLL